MNSVVAITANQIVETVERLRSLSSGVSESVVLWLATRGDELCIVQTVLVPIYDAGLDYFVIPPDGIQDILKRCRRDGVFVAAQVHTHPGAAFHSEADNELAVIRHKNALSFVLPDFAANIEPSEFSIAAQLFRLSEANEWSFVPAGEHSRYYRIT